MNSGRRVRTPTHQVIDDLSSGEGSEQDRHWYWCPPKVAASAQVRTEHRTKGHLRLQGRFRRHDKRPETREAVSEEEVANHRGVQPRGEPAS